MSSREVVAVDLFCGAGGFSEGLQQACDRLGYDLRHAAVNHWEPAIETHERNHPDAHQYHSKVEQLHPPEVIERLADDHDLAHTYTVVNEIEPWQRVQQYRDVTTYTARHPDQGSSAVARALNLPRGRIRSWVDSDGMPDPARGIDTARSRGWLDLDADTSDGRPWVELVAWIYSGGSITRDTHHPTFYVREHPDGPDHDELSMLERRLAEIGVGHQLVDRDPSRATHVQPAEHAVLVGRLLAAMQAPVGEKTPARDLTLPDWLPDSTLDTQQAFARIYLLNRGQLRTKPNIRYSLKEERSTDYLESLADLFRRISDPDAVTRSGHNILLYDAAADAILHDHA